MKNLILAALLLAVGHAFASETEVPESLNLEPEDVSASTPVPVSNEELNVDPDKFNHRKGHWIGQFAFENLKYEMPLNYSGQTKNLRTEDRDLWGLRLGLGREVYLGGGFLVSGRLDGYYLGLLQTDDKVVKVVNRTISSEKDAGQFYGADAIGHIGWMFDYKTKNPFLGEMTYMSMELFAEAGLGKGNSYQRKDYEYDLVAGQRDDYDRIVEDQFTTRIVSVGANFLSTTSGFFFTLKASRYDMTVDERTIREYSQVSGGTVNDPDQVKLNNVDIDPITVFSLGGGYKF